ncbi:peptidase inhibitor I78 [Brevundimonas sp.]|uniref:peptidase inhibitor I78 n=1 Tax=Brevundimonas sp. TaxID=1871086 RepID=UPI00273023C6|nr:peptidase inhibitor I78 [Brevundimonas sp.]MDP1913678.1 peptidase inhibitor I78 [Brevundimonas sp.]
MKKILMLGAALIALSGCVSEPPAPPPADANDKCGAAEAQRFVGRPRSEIPVPVRPEKQRVLCTTCMATMDFREDRLNFFYDADTGVVKRVTCG